MTLLLNGPIAGLATLFVSGIVFTIAHLMPDEKQGMRGRMTTIFSNGAPVVLDVPSISITITEAIVAAVASNVYILMNVRAVNKGSEVTVRDWTLTLGGFMHWCEPIPDGLQFEESETVWPFEEPRREQVEARLNVITLANPLKKGIGVQGWLLFKVRGGLTSEQVIGSNLTLTAKDDLKGIHAVTRGPDLDDHWIMPGKIHWPKQSSL